MLRYKITFYALKPDKKTDDAQIFTYIVSHIELADKIVDELLTHRKSGIKSAFLLFLEKELDCKFKEESSSVVYIDEIKEVRIRKEGGLYYTLKGDDRI